MIERNMTYHSIIACEVGFHVRSHGDKCPLVAHLIAEKKGKTRKLFQYTLQPIFGGSKETCGSSVI